MSVSIATFVSNTLEHQPVFSWYREHAGTIYTSGHVAIDIDSGAISHGDLPHEARVALGNLGRTLARAGSSLEQVLKVTVYLTDMREFSTFNRVYAEFFPGERPPARICVEVSRLPYDLRVAIDAIAFK
jgi:2-iminobutanoate/2-iminopropanoate deaminase